VFLGVFFCSKITEATTASSGLNLQGYIKNDDRQGDKETMRAQCRVDCCFGER
jgi:hypothetical protein